MADVINQTRDTETGKSELWITIKDASDLLGISERHTWRILLENAWKTQKLLNEDRKKTYVLRADVEKYYQAERERQKLEELSSPPSSDTPDIHAKTDKVSEFDKSDIKHQPKSDIKNLPILLSDYRNMMADLQKKQEQLIKNATLWRTTAVWLVVLAVFISGFLGFFLYDSRKMMSDIKKEMTGRINDLSDKADTAQREFLSAKDTLFQKEIWINKLEQSMPKEKIEQLKAEEKKEE
jgi:hypothetical protein